MENLLEMFATFLIGFITDYPAASFIATCLIAFEGVAPMFEGLVRKIVTYTRTQKDDEIVNSMFKSNIWEGLKSFGLWLKQKRA